MTKKDLNKFNATVRLINLVNSIDELTTIDHTFIFFIKELIALWSSKEAVTVSDVISLNHVGSRATLHRQLNRFKKQGYLSLMSNPDDKRIKFITPTQKLLSLINQFELKLNHRLIIK